MRSSPRFWANPSPAIALLRIVTGVLVAPHGIRKLLAGPAHAIGGIIASKGLPYPSLLAWLVTLGELSGILLALGIATRLAGLALAITMAGIVVFVQRDALEQLGTGTSVPAEYPLLLAVLGLFFAMLGPTIWSISLTPSARPR
jgi:putative oxidoreductase